MLVKVFHRLCVSLSFCFRMLLCSPQTKTYFSHWGAAELVPGSAKVKKHGAIIMGGLTKAVKGIDDLTGTLSALSELHATQLRVDPANFKVTKNVNTSCSNNRNNIKR